MAVTRARIRRGIKRYGKSVKARRPWSRKVSTMDVSYRSVIPRIRNPDFGFPDKMVTTLRYVDNVALSATSNGVGSNVFRMNSLFDPDLSGSGHQPMYFDQICGPIGTAPYSRYRVISSKITCRFTQINVPSGTIVSGTAVNYGPIVVGLAATNQSGLYGTSVSALCEASNSTWTYLGDKGAGSNQKTLTATYIPSRDLGTNDGDDTLGALYNANPTEVFHAIPWKIDTQATGVAVACLVSIEFKVEFYDRNEVALS